MAASDQDGSQSDSKNDDSHTRETSKQFSTIHQEIESQLTRPGVSYETRVSAVLSGWEHLAGTVEGDVSQIQPLATFLYRWSLRLILQGEWPALAQIVKTRLGVTLQRCSRVVVLQPLCRTLLPLVSDPWGQTKSTIFLNKEIEDNEAIAYISSETWEVVRVRVDTLIESRIEKYAFDVLKVCIRCIRLRSEGMEVPLYTDEDHNHFVDLYFMLMFKIDRQDFVSEFKKLDVMEGVSLVRRLVAKQDKGKVWRHRLKASEMGIQVLLIKTIVQIYSHNFWCVFIEWCGVQEALEATTEKLSEDIHKFMQLSESSQHIYNMSSILHKKFGNASLVTELLIRALTMDMNSLEALKLKSTNDTSKEEQLRLEQQMAAGFMDLATVFSEHKAVARECVLTAFSLHPTSERLVLLNNFVSEPSNVSSSTSHVHQSSHPSSPSSCTVPTPVSPSSYLSSSSLPQQSSSSYSLPNVSSTQVSRPSSPAAIPPPSSSSPYSASPVPTNPLSPTPPPVSHSLCFPHTHSATSSPSSLVSHSSASSLPNPPLTATTIYWPSSSLAPTTAEMSEEDSTVTGASSMCSSLEVNPSNSIPADTSQQHEDTGDTLCYSHPISQEEHPNNHEIFEAQSHNVSESVSDNVSSLDVPDTGSVEMETSGTCEVQVNPDHDEMDSDLSVKRHSYSEVRETPEGVGYELHITMDTGQSETTAASNLPILPDSQETQKSNDDSGSAQPETEGNDQSQATKDIMSDFVSECIKLVPRNKDDVDSMDRFYQSTENFIEQLSQEPAAKSPQSSSFTNLTKDKIEGLNYDILTQPNQVLDSEQLGLSKELCDDLAVVLSSPRWQVLSWKRDWRELSAICEHYMNDADSAKSITKELKYLNIDYSQFENMPSAEITEFTGIEKGYEHFIEHESESEHSDGENRAQARTDSESSKKVKGKSRKLLNKAYDLEDSDFSKCGRMQGSHYNDAVSYSESEESDLETTRGKTNLMRFDSKHSGAIEGKRVTAISHQDRRKRIRIDDEGKLRRERNLLNTLRLFRPQKYKCDLDEEAKHEPFPSSRLSAKILPPLSSINLIPRVQLTESARSIIGKPRPGVMTTVMAGRSQMPKRAFTSSQPGGVASSWRYAGSLVAPSNAASNNKSPGATPAVSLPRSTSVQCYLRTKDGKVRAAPFNRTYLAATNRPQNSGLGGNSSYFKLTSKPTSGFDDSYAKFLLQQSSENKGKEPSVTITKKSMTLDASLDYLKKQGTTVTYKKTNKSGSTLALANAQKSVLGRIMSPENALSAISNRTEIAMPVSNNPPNMPPSDKTNPANLSRVLPKGTTVVRKPKSDGAGPSCSNNNSGSSSGVSSRPAVTRPGILSPGVVRPGVAVSTATIRSGNSIMTVRANPSSIRTTYSRGVVVSGSMAAQEAVPGGSGSSVPTSVVASALSASTTMDPATGGATVTTALPAPLVSATVVGSVPNNSRSPPAGTLGGNNGKQQQQSLQNTWEVAQSDNVCVSASSPSTLVSVIESSGNLTENSSSTRGATTCTTTVASPPGDTRAASMLETLLRDRPVPPSPLLNQTTTAITTITAALPNTLTSIVGSSSVPIAVSGDGQVTNAVMGTLSSTGNTGNVVIASGSSAGSGVIMASGVVGAPTAGGVVVASGGLVGGSNVAVTTNVGESSGGAVQQVLVPGQLVQVHTSDGSTGLGIVHSSSLDLRLPAGTRVIKSCGGAVRAAVPQQQPVTGVINQTGGRQVNVLHNVKILQNVQNRQIVRTVVVPHTVALQGLSTQTSQLKPQVVALSQGTSTAVTVGGESGVLQAQGSAPAVRAKIPSSTIVQKRIGRSSLVIRTLRPPPATTQTPGETPLEEGLGAKLNLQQLLDGGDNKSSGTSTTTTTTNVTVARLSQDEGLGERLSHYLKTALTSTTSTQSVGTQTLTTAVKPSAGQSVNQVALNNLRSGAGATLTLTGNIQGVPGTSSTISTSPTPSQQQGSLSSLPLTPTNAVSSETLEQLREFESVFEKVSNKSGKDVLDAETTAENYPNTTISSEESMIAAQLLSMANDTPTSTTSSSYVYSVPTTVYDAAGTRLTEGTFITIPSTTQAGTLILVNHGGSGTGLVTVTGGVQSQQQQPPTAASPTLSSTSSHSSIASSPSSTSSKSKKTPPKPKVIPPAAPPVVAKPKTPPPPKAPAPKPTVAKPQVEESDETKARIQAILENYKQELAINPQPQPAPRNRKNCPPPKNEGKSSNKKKSPVKKVDGGAGNSPAVSEGSAVGCPSPSPSPGPASDNSAGLSGSSSSMQTVQYSGQGISGQATSVAGSASVTEEKIKVESSPEVVATAPAQILQGVVVSNVKVEGGNLSSTANTTLSQGLAGGQVVQLIRHGGKVTAITTRQPLNKVKAAGQGGPPPNVTIQGRINMNDLMESHIASLLTGGSTALNQAPSVVRKIIQQQQLTGPQTVQQVVVQASGQPVLQQVAVQQLPTTPVKQQQLQVQQQQEQQQLQQQKCGVIQQLCVASNEEISSPQPTQLTVPPLQTSPPIVTTTISSSNVTNILVTKSITVANASSGSGTSIVVSAPVITSATTSSHNNAVTSSGTPGPSPLSTVPSSPLTPQASTVTSPPTPQPVITSPHTPSPATDPPPTPSSFQMGEESSSSEHSMNESLAGPLPPFFTLKSFIMQSPQQPSQQQQQHQSQQQKQQPQEQSTSDKGLPPGGSSVTTTASLSTTPSAVPETSSCGTAIQTAPSSSRHRGGQPHIQPHISQVPYKASVIRSGGGSVGGRRQIIGGTSEGISRLVGRGTTASPLLTMGGSSGDAAAAAGITVSTMSSPSSQEGSPGTSQSRIRLANRPQDARSSSIDSLKSDLSVEEVQIPPSPATLTKQLQNAYMTEAALSPSVSQSQHSGSSYSSPSTTHDLTITEAPPSSDDAYTSTLTHPGYSAAPSATPGLSVTGVSPEGDAQIAALESPSGGDVYLHQSGTSLGLESLEGGSLPLGVSIGAGLEVRTHSPVLGDLVSSGPLLTWSPRSADSMMVQSPSLNDALTANIPLDVNHSEDSLCDSSTAFPGLFSIEGDRVSVSSSTSEDLPSATPGGGGGVASNPHDNLHQQEQELQEQEEVTIDLHPRESEQDHTITSTRSPTQLELPVATLSSLSVATPSVQQSIGSIVVTQASVAQETPWRFDNNSIGSQDKSVGNNRVVREPANGHHSDNTKGTLKLEDIAGPSDMSVGKAKMEMPITFSVIKDDRGKIVNKAQEVEGGNILEDVGDGARGVYERRPSSGGQSKPDRLVDYKTPSTQEGYSRKRSQRLACSTGRRKSGSESDVKAEEVPTKNGHDNSAGNLDLKIQDTGGGGGGSRKKRRSSQRTLTNTVQGMGRSRTKALKPEALIKEELDDDVKDEKVNMKAENDIKENTEDVVVRTTRGAKRRSEGESHGEIKCSSEGDGSLEEAKVDLKEGDSVGEVKHSEECGGDVVTRQCEEDCVGGEVKRSRGTRSGRRSDGYLLAVDEEVLNHLDDDCSVPKVHRGRHVSGTSDTSSNYSMDCGVSVGVHESSNLTGSIVGRRRRRHSRESSASSRDGSPSILHAHDPPVSGGGGVSTRRSSSRDHAKKKKCSCCGGGGEPKKSSSGSGRRASTRTARASTSTTLH